MNTTPTPDLDHIEKELVTKTITFPSGIPGFTELTKFILIQDAEAKPFFHLRSLETDNLSFPVVEAHQLVKDYTCTIDDRELKSIDSPDPSECALFFIVKVSKEKKIVVETNLRSPIVMNTKKRLAKQFVLSSAAQYSDSARFEF